MRLLPSASRREMLFFAGLAVGLWISSYELGRLDSSAAWADLDAASPPAARYVRAFVVLPFPLTLGLLVLGLGRLLEVQGLLREEKPQPRALPPYPFDPSKTQLITGEAHHQDGSRSETPGWMIQPQRGMYGTNLIVGPTGSSKSQGGRS